MRRIRIPISRNSNKEGWRQRARTRSVLVALLLGTAGTPAAYSDSLAENSQPLDPAQVRSRWLGRLANRHFQAQVTLRIHWGGRIEERRIDVFRDDEDGAGERLMASFETPSDMRGLALLYLENHDRSNDYFLYQPAGRRVRRVPERLAKEDVYGVDLEYLGFGLALIEPSEPISAEWTTLDDRPVIRLEERAITDNPRFHRRIVWLDPDTWIALRTEHWRAGEARLRAATHRIDRIQGIPTPREVTFERPLEGETVTMIVNSVDYEAPIPQSFFSTLKLIQAH